MNSDTHESFYKQMKIMNKWKRKSTKEWLESRKAYFKKAKNDYFEYANSNVDNISNKLIDSTMSRSGILSSTQMSKFRRMRLEKSKEQQKEKEIKR